MNKREAILFLEKKRDKAIGDMNFFGEGSRKGLMNEIRVNTYDIAINTLQQIDEPIDTLAQEYDVEPETIREWLDRGHNGSFEKVVVSQEFADWVEKAKTVKDGLDYKNWCVKEIATIGWGNWLHDPERILDGKVIYNEWVNAVADNKEKHIKAIYDGYTVKPKRWVVKNGDKYFEKFSGCGLGRAWAIYQDQAYPFDDKSKAEAVAVLVEGSVEEV